MPAQPVGPLPPILVPEPVIDLVPIPPPPDPGVPLPGPAPDTVITDVLGTLPPPPAGILLRER
jgi:hypothetical protein